MRWAAIILCLLWLLPMLLARAPVVYAQETAPQVVLLRFKGPVTPILLRHIERGVAVAQETGAEAVVLQLDTPGGSVDLTQTIIQRMLQAPVPVVVYVAPAGAHAGSAGTFITLAGHVAAMAPGSSIGAASPVGGGGEDLPETIKSKLINILTADVENLAARRGDAAVTFAREAVEKARAATADEALDLGVIDFVASDLPDLLQQMDGFAVTVDDETRVLHTTGAEINELRLGLIDDFLNVITNPAIAAILLTLGLNALLLELSSPGGYVAGIVGAVLLLLAFYALGTLDANWTGLGFIILAFVLFVLDIKAPTHGALTAGGIVSFVVGAAILFNVPFVEIPWETIIVLALLTAAFFVFAIAKGLQAQQRQPTTGLEGMIGDTGEVRAALEPRGRVFVSGELWEAESLDGTLPVGTAINVVGHSGMRLRVRRKVNGNQPH
jgi:membrane-bound serine protease (ClpP class)